MISTYFFISTHFHGCRAVEIPNSESFFRSFGSGVYHLWWSPLRPLLWSVPKPFGSAIRTRVDLKCALEPVRESRIGVGGASVSLSTFFGTVPGRSRLRNRHFRVLSRLFVLLRPVVVPSQSVPCSRYSPVSSLLSLPSSLCRRCEWHHSRSRGSGFLWSK